VGCSRSDLSPWDRSGAVQHVRPGLDTGRSSKARRSLDCRGRDIRDIRPPGRVVLGVEYETRAATPLIGHWWGFFVPVIPGLVLIGGLLIQLQIYNRHRRRVREGR